MSLLCPIPSALTSAKAVGETPQKNYIAKEPTKSLLAKSKPTIQLSHRTNQLTYHSFPSQIVQSTGNEGNPPVPGWLFPLRTILAEVRQSPIYNKEWERGGRRGRRKKIRHFVHFPAYLFARKNRTHYICSVLQRWYTNTISILTINNLPAMGANVAAGQLQNRNHDTGKKH